MPSLPTGSNLPSLGGPAMREISMCLLGLVETLEIETGWPRCPRYHLPNLQVFGLLGSFSFFTQRAIIHFFESCLFNVPIETCLLQGQPRARKARSDPLRISPRASFQNFALLSYLVSREPTIRFPSCSQFMCPSQLQVSLALVVSLLP